MIAAQDTGIHSSPFHRFQHEQPKDIIIYTKFPNHSAARNLESNMKN